MQNKGIALSELQIAFGYAWRKRLGDPVFNMDKNISKVSER